MALLCSFSSMHGITSSFACSHSELDGLNAGLYYDGGILLGPAQSTVVDRLENETQLTVLFPNNGIARESVTRYAEALKSVFVRVAEGCDPARASASVRSGLMSLNI